MPKFQNNYKFEKKKLQIPGSNLSESCYTSGFGNKQGQVGKNWGRKRRVVVRDLNGSTTAVRKSKCALTM